MRYLQQFTPGGDVSEADALIEKLAKIEALFARPGTEGERVAAGNARDRIRARLRLFERTESAVEYKFSLQDTWSRTLFMALLRRYELHPYRYRGQRRTTVMVKVTRRFVEETLWPEYRQLEATLRTYLNDVTQRVISTAIWADVTEAEERAEKPGAVLGYDGDAGMRFDDSSGRG